MMQTAHHIDYSANLRLDPTLPFPAPRDHAEEIANAQV